jgi:hypothetical protein
MGTRGALGFRAEGKDYITYNHFDSYLSGLGEAVLTWLKAELAAGEEQSLRERVTQLRFVDGNTKPTPAEIEQYKHLADFRVSTGDDWYSLLRNTQGDPAAILAAGVMADAHKFLNDSLFCEYAYIVNFDSRELEVYRGFQTTPANQYGRYAKPKKPRNWKPKYEGESYYYPVGLIAVFSFDALPESLTQLEPVED